MILATVLKRSLASPFRRLAFLPARSTQTKTNINKQNSTSIFSIETKNYNNDTASSRRIEIPPRKYGYRTEPFSWQELQKIIVQEQNLARLSRSVEQEEVYQLYRHDLLQEYSSVYDHILHSKFGFPKSWNTAMERWETPRPKDSISKQEQDVKKAVVLAPNDFPYFTEPGIEHWVLWKLYSKVSESDIVQAKQELMKQLGNVVDSIHWENPPHLKSLPDIDHVHILVQRKDD